MDNISSIKKRISIVNDVLKFTEAMTKVSISEYNYLIKDLRKRTLFKDLSRKPIFESILREKLGIKFKKKIMICPESKEQKDENLKSLILVFGANKGMCGDFVSMLSYEFYDSLGFAPKYTDLILVGKDAEKSIPAKSKGRVNIIKKFSTFSKKNINSLSFEISNFIFSKIEQYKELSFLYSGFISISSQKPKLEKIYPILKYCPETLKNEMDVRRTLAFYPNKKTFFKKILETYLTANIKKALSESLLSENCSRFMAMEAASKVSKTMIDKLKHELYLARQEKINKEISEIVAGSF